MHRADPHHDPGPAALPPSVRETLPSSAPFLALVDAVRAVVQESQLRSVCFGLAAQRRLIGVAGLGGGVPTRPQLLCSLGKPLTAHACLLLAQEGKLDLDAPLKTYLPVSGQAARITVRQLLTHRSGLRTSHLDLAAELQANPSLPRREGTLFEYELVCHALTKPLQFAPGAGFLYSSLGYQVLGRVLESVVGQRADRVLQAKVLEPLGIRSYVATSYLSAADRARLSYLPQPERLQTLSQTSWGCNDMAGAACLSALDYLRFLAAFRGTLTPALQRQLSRPAGAGYGLGWQLRESTGPTRRVSGLAHTGTWTSETHLATSWASGVSSVCLIESADERACYRVQALVEQACLSLPESQEGSGTLGHVLTAY